MRIFRLRLNRAGYTSDGRYFGIGDPVYCCELETGFVRYVRAPDRKAAIDYFKRTN